MPSTTARKPSTAEIQPWPPPATIIAPTTVMPLTAFAPDISGVCSVVGTRLISATPRKVARVKITIPPMSVSGMLVSPDGAVVHDAGGPDDRIGEIHDQRAVPDGVLDEALHVAAVHLARVKGERRRQVHRAEDADAVRGHRLARARELAVASALRGEVHDDAPRLHRAHHRLGDDARRGTAGNLRRGDDEVDVAHVLRHRLADEPLLVGSELARVAPGGLRIRSHRGRLHEGGAEALHLLLHDGPHIECGDDRAE